MAQHWAKKPFSDSLLYTVSCLIIFTLLALFFSVVPVQSAEIDKTECFEFNRGRPYYDYANQQTYSLISLTNISTETFNAPLKLVITSITASQVTVSQPDGLTTNNKPFFYLTAPAVDLNIFSTQFGHTNCVNCQGDLDQDTDIDGNDLFLFISTFGQVQVDETIVPGESSSTKTLRFNNPDQLQFDFTIQVLIEGEDSACPVQINRERPYYDYANQQTYTSISVTNIGQQPLTPPIKTVVTTITVPDITVANPDGNTNSLPYLDFSDSLGDGVLDPGETSQEQILRFANPEQLQFDFTMLPSCQTEETPNNPPLIIPVEDQQIDEGSPLTIVVNGSDPDDDPLTFTAANLPAGAYFNPVSRTFNWTPSYSQAGNYQVNFSVVDSGGLTSTDDVTIIVNNLNRRPIINPISDSQVAESKNLTFEVSGHDPDGDPLTFAAANLPTGAYFDTVSQTFTWIPPAGFAGTYQVRFAVSDGLLAAETSTMITVLPYNPNSSPVITPIPVQHTDENQLLVYEISASDPNGDPLTWDTSGLPSGASVELTAEPNTYEVHWQPDYDQAGSYLIITTVADPDGLSDVATVQVIVNNINRPPTLQPVAPRSIAETKTLYFKLYGSDPDNDPLIYATANLPTGAMFNPEEHTFSWAPGDHQAGSYTVSFTVSDGSLEASQTAEIEVIDFDPATSPSWIPINPQEVDEGLSLTFTITASDPNPENQDSLNITAGGMPTAAALEAGTTTGSRVFSWQPSFSQAGTYPVAFTVTNADNRSDILNVTILVHDVNRPPVLAAIDNRTTDENLAITIQAEASDPDNNPLTFEIIGLPAGATINPETGFFSWTPTYDQAGSYPMTWIVSDGTMSAQEEMTIEVNDVNRPPVILTATIPDAHIDQEYGIIISANDPDGDPLTFTLSESTAPLLTIDAASGSLSWHPTMADIGTYQLTVQASDGRGGTTEQLYQLQLADTIPPAVSLNLPLQAHPGAVISAAVLATDNNAVTAINVNGNRTDFPSPYKNQIHHQQEITLPAELGSHLVQATAWDSSGNSSTAYATINVVATFDTTPPQVSLSAPVQAARGQEIVVSTLATDDVGVASINLFANGSHIGTPPTTRPVLKYIIPGTANDGDLITFRAEVLDFSGNPAEDETVTTVVESSQADTEAPIINAEIPASIKVNELLPITIETNETCLANIEIIIHHILAASYVSPNLDTFQVPLPAGVKAGMTVLVEINVTDCSDNQSHFESPLLILAPSRGLVAGEVYDDSTGLPLAAATITFFPAAGDLFTTETDELGRYSLPTTAGEGRLAVSKNGFSTVERPGLTVPESGGLEIFDARLTLLSNQEQTVTATTGGALVQPFSLEKAGYLPILETMGQDVANLLPGEITFVIPAGSLSDSQSFSLHQVSPQGLAGALPIGWSPVGIADIHPGGILLQVPGILTLPNHLGLDQPPILATWDEAVHAWRMIGTAEIITNGQKLQAEIDLTGQFAFLLPDQLPQPPPQPTVNDLLQGTTPILIPETANTVINPKPQVIFYQPGVASDVATTISELTPPLPSGIPALIGISERYDFYTSGDLTPAPIYQDVRLYSYNQPLTTATFPVTPSWEFAPLSLNQGIIDVDFYSPLNDQRSIPVIGPAGGSTALDSGKTLTFSPGCVDDFIPAVIKPFDPTVPDLQLPSSLIVLDGMTANFFGQSPAAPATLSLPAPVGLNGQEQILLLKLQEVQGATHLALVGLGELDDQIINSICRLPGDNETIFDGLRNGGRYLFAYLADELAFVRGQVLDPDGEPVSGALITTDDLPIVAVSGKDGTYTTAVTTNGFTITTLDPTTMNSGTITGGPLSAGEILNLTLSLVPAPPTVISFLPANGQENIPLETSVSITFSEPLDPATVTAQNLTCSGPQGPVAGTLGMTENNSRIVFRPTAPLIPNTTYTFSISTNIRDLAGYTLEAPLVFSFTSLDTLPPALPAAAVITATIPDTGQTTVSATQGTAGAHDTVTIINQTQELYVPVLVNPDGSFSTNIDAELMDEIVISITDPAGNETKVNLGRFKNSDGHAVIGPEGGQLEADNNIILDIPPGAFPEGAVVRIAGMSEEDVGTSPGPDFPFVAGFEVECSVKPEIYLNASAPLPANAGPQSTGIVANIVTAFGKPALSIVDTAKVIDGRLATSSPPCPGVLSKFDRYAMYLNEHEQMQLGMAILSMAPPATRNVVVQPYILNSFFLPPVIIPGIKFDETYYPAYEFVNMIQEGKPVRGVMAVAEHPYYCLPVPADVPLKVVVRDADTGEVLQAIDVPETGAGDSLDITDELLVSEDTDPPVVVMTEWSPEPPHILDPGKLIAFRFSEPVQLKGDNPIYLINEESQQIINGHIELLANNRVVVFLPDQTLSLGKSYKVVMTGVEDLAGNAYEDPPGEDMTFSTFTPHIISTLDKAQVATGLGITPDSLSAVHTEGYSMVFTFGLKDLDFITKRPTETGTGLWETHISAVRRDRGNGPALLTIDASNPMAPAAVGGTSTLHNNVFGEIQIFDDLHLEPRDSDYADPDFWRNRQLHYVVKEPSIRICGEPGSQEITDWRVIHCQEEGDCEIITGGCGDLAVATVTQSTDYAWLNLYDVTDPSDPKWISFRALSENRGAETSYSQDMWWAPAGLGFAEGFSVLQHIDITHKRPILIPGWLGDDTMTHEDTIGAYVAVENIGIELVDIGLNFPPPDEWHERLHPENPGTNIVHYESLGLNSHLYYRDVQVIGDKVVAVSGDELDGTNIRFLEVFNLDLSGPVYPPLQIPYHIPERLKSTAGYLPIDRDGNGQMDPHEIIFTTGAYGGVTVLLMCIENIPPEIAGFYRTPFDVRTKHVEVDLDNKLAYVGAQWKEGEGTVEGILILDIRDPTGGPFDADEDEWDDRIIGKIKITGTAEIPVGTVGGFRLDPERHLIYAGIQSLEACLVIIKTCNCPGVIIPSGDPSAGPGSVSVNLNSGSITVGGEEKAFESDDGITGNLFVHAVPSLGGEVCANLDIEATPGLEIRYQITERPISGDPADAMLDLSGGAGSGVLDPSSPDICLSLIPSESMPIGSYVYLDIQDTAGNFLDRLLLTVTPATLTAENVRLKTLVDRINGDFCAGFAPLRFNLSHEAEVTIRVDGKVIDQTIAGENKPMQDVFLPPGINQVTILKDMVPNPGEHDFEITAVFNRQDPNIQVSVSGKIVHDIVINENLPIGHSSVKNIDLMDGHLSIVRKDFAIKGLGPDLQFIRSYGSVGNRSSGPIGAGWSHNYESKLVFDSCGHVTIVGGEGSGTRFSNPVPDVDDQDQSILRYQPQAGYHGILNYYQTDDEYDFYTKSRTRYHYEQEPEPTALSNYTLRFIEDPFGNRLALEYDQNSPYKLIAVRDSSGRTLGFTYGSFGTVPENRIVKVSGPLGLEVSFEYDAYGNLTKTTRGIRSEAYEYSTDHPRDKHNMTRIIDPNGNSTEYVYYSDQDPFSGLPDDFDWDTQVLVFPEKYEFVRNVVEGSGSPDQETTQFSYNYADHQEKVLTTVVDAWNVTTLHTMNPRGGAVEKRVYMASGNNISRTKWAYEEGINDVYMTENIEPNGRITRFSYDSNGNLTEQTIDLSNLTGYEPAFNGDQVVTQITNRSIFDQKFNKPVQSVDSMGNITDYVLNPENGAVLSKTTYPEAGKSISLSFIYYPNGLLETTTDGLGNITRFTEYDAYGNNTRMIDPLGNEIAMVYDDRSRLIESSDSMGHRSTTQYDELDNVISVTSFSASTSDDRTITYTYYPNGKKKTQIEELNHTTEYFYDVLNRLVNKVDHLEDLDGNAISYEWTYTIDPISKTTIKTGPRGVSTTSHMDELHRLTEVTVQGPFGPNQVLSRFQYDPVGNKISETALTGAVTTYDYDGLYRMVRKTLPISDDEQTYTEQFAFDLSGNKLSETNVNGNQIRYEYDDTYRLITHMDALGNTVRYGYDNNGNMVEKIQESRGLLTLSEYDPLNRLTDQTQTFTDPITQAEINYISQTQYNDAIHTLTMTDPAGKQVLEVFDGLDQLISKTVDPGGLSLTTEFIYDANGNITRTIDPKGMIFESTYDGLNRRNYSRYLPQNFEETFRYDGADHLIEHTDKRNISTEYTYDNLGRRRQMLLHESITQPGNVLTLKEYVYEDQSPHPRMIEIDARGNQFTHVYDLMGREVRTIDPMGNEIRQQYDGINRIARIDQRGYRTQYEFDALNRPTRVIDPNGSFTEVRCLDNLNQVLNIDKKGIQTRYQYDALERLRQVAASLTSATSFDIVTETHTYRGDNLFHESIDANGNVTRYEYDNAGRLVTQIAAFGSSDESRTTWTYDGIGRTLSVRQGRMHSADHDMAYVYDDANRTVRAFDAVGNETRTTIDGGKNILSITNPNGNQEMRIYDELGKLLTITDALGNVTRYEYDDNRNLVMQEDANGNRVTYDFDANDRLTDISRIVDVNTSRHTQNIYDVAGNLLETIDPKDQHTAFEYNVLNLLATKTYSNHVDPIFPHILRIEYDYDLNDNTIEVREVKRISNTGDPAQDEMGETTTMQYDNLNRLAEIHNTDGKTIQYGYDSNGNRTSLTGPDNLVTGYVFDAMNRLIQTDAAEGSTIHTYHPDGLPLQTIYPNGIRTENDYDNAGRFTEIRHVDDQETILFRLGYTYDGNGNPLTQTFAGPGTPSETTGFTYDITDRMTQADYPNEGILDYIYDAVGNRLTEIGTDPLDSISPVNRAYEYDTLDQLIRVSDLADPSGNVDLEYDFNGNLIRKTTNGVSLNFGYDIRDQLTSTGDILHGGNILFDYDYEGLRTKKISSAGETRYLYDGGSVLAEYDGSPGFATLRKYSYGRGLLSLTDHSVPAVDPSHTQFYLTDALGSTICMADTGGATQKTYKYDAWGNILEQDGNSGNPRTFTGHFLDEETGLLYFGARYYDSSLGRFISQDPDMGDTTAPITLHRYLYANANPMRYVDLDGHKGVSFGECWLEQSRGVREGIDQAGQEMITETGAMVADVGMGAIKMLLLSPRQRRAVEKSRYLSRARSHIGRQIQDGVPLKQIVLESAEGIVMTPVRFVKSLTDMSISPQERGKLLFGTVASVGSIYGGIKTVIRLPKKIRATTHSLKAGYQALKLMKHKRSVGLKKGAYVFKDAYNLAKAGVKAGKLRISGGLTEKAANWSGSAENLLSNLKESFKGRRSMRAAEYNISKGKLPGDLDTMIGGRKIPKVMADTKWARELNRQAGVPLYDITPGHGINGIQMPKKLMGEGTPVHGILMDKVRMNPKLLDGNMVKAGPYLEEGIFFTGAEAKMMGGPATAGRYAVIVKHGKVVFRKPQKVIYYNRFPEIPLGWLDPVESVLGGPMTPWGNRMWATGTASGMAVGLWDQE